MGGDPPAPPAVEATQQGGAVVAAAAAAGRTEVLEAHEGQDQVVGGGHREDRHPLRGRGIVQEARRGDGCQEETGEGQRIQWQKEAISYVGTH